MVAASFFLGLCVLLVCSLFHTLACVLVIRLFVRLLRQGYTGSQVWRNALVVDGAVLLTFLSHLGQVALWGMVLVWCGEFQQFGVAFYASLGNYTTVGTGTVVMSESWRLLGPLETMNGVLMAGMTTSVLFAVLHRVIESHLRYLEPKLVSRLP
jgi:hypothetical protein